ncbi:hypothetical protein [Polaromonas sp.]|uniref:hypothetical protein n=1 Tax=Polaromonas sp. TaxID=1869339 RepID=UPI003529FCE1
MSATTTPRQQKLGRIQVAVLSMACPEWPTRSPDARSVRVLHTLETRGLAYENRGRWYISAKGRELLVEAEKAENPSD